MRIGGSRLEWQRRPGGRCARAPARVAGRLRLGLRLRPVAEGQGAACGSAPTARPARRSRPACRKDPHYVPALADLVPPPLPCDGLRRCASTLARRRPSPSTRTTRSPNYYYGLAAAEARPDGTTRATASSWPRSPSSCAAPRGRSSRGSSLRGGDLAPGRLRRGAEPRLQRAQPRGAPAPRPRPPPRRRAGRRRGCRRRRAARRRSAQPLRPLREGARRGRTTPRRARSPRASATRCRRRPSSSSPPGTTTSAAPPRARRCWSCRRQTAEVLYWRARLEDAPGRRRSRRPSCRRPTRRLPSSCSPSARSPPRCCSGRLRAAPAGARATTSPSSTGAPATWTRRAGSSTRAARRPTTRRSTPRGRWPSRAPRRERSMADLERAARLDPAPVARSAGCWRTASCGQGAPDAGARDDARLRRTVPRQLHPRDAPREGAPRERAVPGERRSPGPAPRHARTRARSKADGSTARRG